MLGHGSLVPPLLGCEPRGVWGLGVVVDGVVVVGVDVLFVDWVLVDLGAAAEPAIPATAPPVASAPTTIPILIVLALLIGNLRWSLVLITPTMLGDTLKRTRTGI